MPKVLLWETVRGVIAGKLQVKQNLNNRKIYNYPALSSYSTENDIQQCSMLVTNALIKVTITMLNKRHAYDASTCVCHDMC